MIKNEEEIKFFEASKNKSDKIKILVYGLLPRQQKVISDHFQSAAEFTFVKKNVKYCCGMYDYVIISVKFAIYSDFNFIKSKSFERNIRLLIHKGGLVTLIEKIDALIEQTNKKSVV